MFFYPFFISLNCGAVVTQSFPVKWSLKRLSKLFPQYSEKHIALRIRSEAMQALYADALRRASKGACDRQCRTVIAGHYIFPSHSAGPFELLSSIRCRCEGHASSIYFRFLSLKPTRLCSPCWKTAAGVVLFTRKASPAWDSLRPLRGESKTCTFLQRWEVTMNKYFVISGTCTLLEYCFFRRLLFTFTPYICTQISAFPTSFTLWKHACYFYI